ncbi:MAG: phosphoglycerate kinase [Candidatus Aenigmatarchaeota archaeon]
MSQVKSVRNLNIKDRKILVRVDFDTPLDENGDIVDDHRIRICIPTIEYILKQDPKQLILIWKLDRPENQEERLKTDKTARRASELLNRDITKIDNWGENGLPEDKIIALENLRFNKKEQGNKSKKDQFGKELASLGDVFINDAFAMAHRKDASVFNIAKYIQGGIGLNFEREIRKIREITEDPQRPFTVILGGAKSDKIDSIDNLMGKADNILLGGVLANTFLKKMGYEIGQSAYFHEKLGHVKEIMKSYEEKIIIPEDVLTLSEDRVKNTDIGNISEEAEIYDIGTRTIEKYRKIINDSNSIYWAGPLGMFEDERFRDGTEKVMEELMSSDQKILIGGGDTSSALKKFGLTEKVTFVSSGGGASLRTVEDSKLPALEILKGEENDQ